MKRAKPLSVKIYKERYDKLRAIMNLNFPFAEKDKEGNQRLPWYRKAVINREWNKHKWLATAYANRGLRGQPEGFDLVKVNRKSKAAKALNKSYGSLKTNKGYWIRKPKQRRGNVQEVGIDDKGNFYRRIGKLETVTFPIDTKKLVANPDKYLRTLLKGYKIKSISWVLGGSTTNKRYLDLSAFIEFLKDFYLEKIDDGHFNPTAIEVIAKPIQQPNAQNKKPYRDSKGRFAKRPKGNSRKGKNP